MKHKISWKKIRRFGIRLKQVMNSLLDVEPHANCSYDYVALYDGTSENDPKIIQHCGQNLPTPTATFYATGNKMFIRMKVKNAFF